MTPNPGARLASFEILCHLGSGGMGEVNRARDTKLEREVAVKVLPDAFAKDSPTRQQAWARRRDRIQKRR